jgi:hypothetical protein
MLCCLPIADVPLYQRRQEVIEQMAALWRGLFVWVMVLLLNSSGSQLRPRAVPLLFFIVNKYMSDALKNLQQKLWMTADLQFTQRTSKYQVGGGWVIRIWVDG